MVRELVVSRNSRWDMAVSDGCGMVANVLIGTGYFGAISEPTEQWPETS